MKNRCNGSIYKYCTCEVATLIIDSNHVRLNKATEFNDPYDSSILFSDKDLRVSSDIVMDYFGELAIRKLIDEHFHNFPLKHKLITIPAKFNLYLNQKMNEKFKEYKPALRFSRLLRIFNKLGMKNGKPDSLSQKSMEDIIKLRKNKVLENTMSEELLRKSDVFLISCFSKKFDSVLMWSHYAKNNKGVSIEFENEGFLDVKYSKKRSVMVTKNIMYKVLWNYHTNTNIQHNNERLTKYMGTIAPLLTKSKEWEYESEVRCILPMDNDKVIYKNDMYFYRMNKIKSITLGCRVSKKERNELLPVCKSKGIPVFEMVLSDNTYDFKRNKILNEYKIPSNTV